MGENAIAVADGKDGRNDLQTRAGRGGLHSLGVAEIALVHTVEDLELVVGQQNRRVTAAAGAFDQVQHPIGVLVDQQVRAAIDPALAEQRFCKVGGTARDARGNHEEGEHEGLKGGSEAMSQGSRHGDGLSRSGR